MVVGVDHDEVGFAIAVVRHDALGAAPLHLHLLDFPTKLEIRPLRFGERLQALNHLAEPPHGVPDTQVQIDVRHDRIEGGSGPRTAPEEDEIILKDLPRLIVVEDAGHETLHVLKDAQLVALGEETEVKEVEWGAVLLVDEVLHGDVVLVLALVQVGLELRPAIGFQPIEQGQILSQICRHIENLVLAKEEPVRGIQPHQAVEVLGGPPEVGEEPIEHVRHEVPGGPHVKPEPPVLVDPSPPTGLAVLLQHGDLIASLA